MPARTGVMQVGTLSAPSTIMAQSGQRPTPQKRPRGAPSFGVVRQRSMPCASSAIAIGSPARAVSGRPSTVIATSPPAGAGPGIGCAAGSIRIGGSFLDEARTRGEERVLPAPAPGAAAR